MKALPGPNSLLFVVFLFACNSEPFAPFGSDSETNTPDTSDVCPDDGDCVPGSKKCPSSCYKDRIIFVSSVKLRGFEIGGKANADLLCNDLAFSAGLFSKDEIEKLPMKAWLSQSGDNAIDSIKFGKGRYFLPRNPLENIPDDDLSLLVVDTFEDFSTPLLKQPINRDENGKEYIGGLAWTNTNLKGKAITFSDKGTCGQWQTECCWNCECEGFAGNISVTDETWTALTPPYTSICFDKNHIYCIESM